MKKSERRILVLAVVVVVIVMAQLVFCWVTESSLKAMRAQIQKPASVVLHESLVAIWAEGEMDRESEMDREGENAPEPAVQEAVDTIAGYDRLFAHIDEMHAQENVPDYSSLSDESSDEEKEDIAAFLHANQDLIREIRAMAERGGPVSLIDFSDPSASAGEQLPRLAKMRVCARLLKADSIIKALEGSYSEAVDDIVAGLKLADALAHEPSAISQLLRTALSGIMNDALQSSVQGGNLPPDLISRLVAQGENSKNRHELAESFHGERRQGISWFAQVRDGTLSSEAIDGVGMPGESWTIGGFANRLYFRFHKSPLGRPWLNMDEGTYSDIMTRSSYAAELPFYEAQPYLAEIREDTENLSFTRILSRSMFHPEPVQDLTTQLCQIQAGHEAMLDLMRMGLLVEQYQAEHGMLPETLDVIAPSLGGSVPVDPFTGEPYRHELSGDTFLLYSVGQNMTDEGGTHDFSDGDLVWRGKSE